MHPRVQNQDNLQWPFSSFPSVFNLIKPHILRYFTQMSVTQSYEADFKPVVTVLMLAYTRNDYNKDNNSFLIESPQHNEERCHWNPDFFQC